MARFTAENTILAREIIARYPRPKSALIPLLHLAQEQDGFVADDAMEHIAELVGVTPAQVQSVASFYTMFKPDPVGRYLVSVCTSISCHLLGGDEVFASVEQASGVEHGQTSEDGTFTVEHVECIGACGGAPAVQVNYETVEGLTVEKAEALVAWLRETAPAVVLADEMQQLFGGQRSFPWGPTEPEGAMGPVPAFAPYGSAGEGR